MGDVTEFRPRKPRIDEGVRIEANAPPPLLMPEAGSEVAWIDAKSAAGALRKVADRLEAEGSDVCALVTVVHFLDDDKVPYLFSPQFMSQVEVAHALAVMSADVLGSALDAAVSS